jgi:hypothetical protein
MKGKSKLIALALPFVFGAALAQKLPESGKAATAAMGNR